MFCRGKLQSFCPVKRFAQSSFVQLKHLPFVVSINGMGIGLQLRRKKPYSIDFDLIYLNLLEQIKSVRGDFLKLRISQDVVFASKVASACLFVRAHLSAARVTISRLTGQKRAISIAAVLRRLTLRHICSIILERRCRKGQVQMAARATRYGAVSRKVGFTVVL